MPVARPRFFGKVLAIVDMQATSLPHMAPPWRTAKAQSQPQCMPSIPSTPPMPAQSKRKPAPPINDVAPSVVDAPQASVSRPQCVPMFEPREAEMPTRSSCDCSSENLLFNLAE